MDKKLFHLCTVLFISFSYYKIFTKKLSLLVYYDQYSIQVASHFYKNDNDDDKGDDDDHDDVKDDKYNKIINGN